MEAPQIYAMKTVLPEKSSFVLIAILLSLSLPLSAYGGTIKTAITSRQSIQSSGAMELDVEIWNRGNATAHNVVATLILSYLVKGYDGLGDNPPGGKIRLKDKISDPELRPGKYVAVLKVDFEEQNGKRHRAYHFLNIPYRLNRVSPLNPPLSFKLGQPCFNSKAFWKKTSQIDLSIKNDGKEAVRPNVWLFLPDGFTAPAPNRSCELVPGEEKMEKIALRLEPDGKNQSPYNLVVWYDWDDSHYSWHLKGKIRVEERSVYFKWYLVFGAAILIILFAVIFIRRRNT